MSNTETAVQTQQPKNPLKAFFEKDFVKAKFNEVMGKNSTSFITSVLQIVNSNELLKNASPESIYNSAMVAATLNLPLNNNLGFAYIVPYSTTKTGDMGQKEKVTVAQFQLGYKGFIQLAQRSGQFKRIAVTQVLDGQIVNNDPLKGYEFDWNKKGGEVVGYVSFFELLNGYEAMLYMSKEELRQHGVRFSQTFKRGYGLWKDDFDSMAKKTVLKLLLSRYAPLSVDMQKASVADQSVINDVDTMDVSYVDASPMSVKEINDSKEIERVKEFIQNAKNRQDLLQVVDLIEDYGLVEIYDLKVTQIDAANG